MRRFHLHSGTEPQQGSEGSGGDDVGSASGPPELIATGIPMAQVVPRTLLVSPAVVMLDQPRSAAAERFRRLKTKLFSESRGSSHVVVVTSPAPREGKSFVALNLALALATDEGQTLLVDADLRRPTIQDRLSPQPALGLTEILEGSAKLEHGIIHLKDSPLTVLPSGKAARDPVELFASAACRNLFESLRMRFQTVIVDTPPILPFTDAEALGFLADGVLLVVRAGSTPRTAYKQALSLISSAPILGTVLNDVTFSLADHGYRHDYYYKRYDQEKREG